ncbi:MAG: sugar ABC transporter permease, partial [Mesorhizobium sp.]
MAVPTVAVQPRPSILSRSLSTLAESRNALGFGFMLPAAALLLVFLTYPLGLGVWLG